MDKEKITSMILAELEKNPDISNEELASSFSVDLNVIEDTLRSLSDTREKILLVDEEVDALTALKVALESDGYNVVEALDGLEALNMARSENPDVILLDIMMPGMDGFEVCKRLKSDPQLSSIPVIMLTAKGEVDDKVEGLEMGADDYVTKPFNLKELKARIKSVIRRNVL